MEVPLDGMMLVEFLGVLTLVPILGVAAFNDDIRPEVSLDPVFNAALLTVLLPVTNV